MENKIGRHKDSSIRMTKSDKESENYDKFSIIIMFVIIIGCFIVGITVGYILYNLAINSSDSTAFIVRNDIIKL